MDIGQVVFFACLWTEKEPRSTTRKKERGQNQAILTESLHNGHLGVEESGRDGKVGV